MQRIKQLTNTSLLITSFFIAVLIGFVNNVQAQDSTQATIESHESEHHSTEAHGDKKVDAGKLIMEHIMDSHDWHLFGHTSIPLPVILYNSERGLTMFMSNKLHHGQMAYKGYIMEEGHAVAVNELETMPEHEATVNEELTAKTYDISISKNVAAMLVSMLIMFVIFNSIAKAYTNKRKGLAPRGLQNALEPIILFIRDDIAKASIGEKKYAKYMPFLLTIFFFILINNLLGLIPIMPGGANVTGNIAIALVLATMTFIISCVSANKAYWMHVIAMPGVPKPILLLLTPIEILGVFLRPFVLMIRLFANITAGHIIILSFFCLIFIFGEMSPGLGYGVSVMSLLFTIFMSALELLVAFLQAYVFTLLSAVYFGMATAEEEHH